MKLDFEKMGGLIPAIVQDNNTSKVLMLGFMNQEAYDETVSTGKVTFFSRTKNRLWMKGESSGNTLQVVSITADCDNDTLLIKQGDSSRTSLSYGSGYLFRREERRGYHVLEIFAELHRASPSRNAGRFLYDYLIPERRESYGPESRRRSGRDRYRGDQRNRRRLHL